MTNTADRIAARIDTRRATDSSEKNVNDHGACTETASSPVPDAAIMPTDFPPPVAGPDGDEFVFDEGAPVQKTYAKLGEKLNLSGDLYRRAGYASGLMVASPNPNVPPIVVTDGARLASILVDRLQVRVVRDGDLKGRQISRAHLNTMLGAETFLRQFRPVDLVTRVPLYLPDFRLTAPGWNDGGRGHRIFYAGSAPEVSDSIGTIEKFLDVMAFATNADRTNAVAFGLTVMLRNHWPGSKPVFTVTGTKSHAGKETIVMFATGANRATSVSYQRTDWALERAFVGAVKHHPDTAVIDIENARLDRGGNFIASGFLERFITDAEPTLFSTGSGGPTSCPNHFVVAITTNFGSLSTDLMNRSLPIHLAPIGNVEDRSSPIGNPKEEFLPASRMMIEAELRGMIERWKEAGRRLDAGVKHPFTQWAQTIGGILNVNGFKNFFENYTARKAIEDPLRKALGLLGAAHPAKSKEPNDGWMTPAGWAATSVQLGLVRTLIPPADRDSEKGRERGIGVVLSAHQGETFRAETDDEEFVLELQRLRRRHEGGVISTRYRFLVLDSRTRPADDASDLSADPK